ncbi:MAG: M18 family aminopeptidase [Clostridia bacterium]|nr:M18 family aminopeptidase [Clostridia bacterium]
MEKVVREFLDFAAASPTAWHAVETIARRMEAEGWQRIEENERWSLKPGGRYFVIRNGSSLIAFILPEDKPASFRMTAAHGDSPTFRIKAVPEMKALGHYTQLDTEPYGGMIMSTWLDRPLSIAGRLLVREGDRLVTRLVAPDRDLCVIPNVPIHFNREVNNGYTWKPQVDLVPLWGSKDAPSLMQVIADEAGCTLEDIAGYDLCLVNRVPGCVWGPENDYLSAGRLDDLECAWACVESLLASEAKGHVNLCCVFDNEEVGSGTRQGADSSFLEDVLDRIALSLGCDNEEKKRLLAASLMVSADNAHACHPNHPELFDNVNRVWMNEGVVIKHNARQKYTTDAVTSALFSEICKKAGVPVQHYANRSDLPGGGTLGNISNRHVSVPSVDIGLAQLAMHSAWETAGALDLPLMTKALRVYYEQDITLVRDGVYRLG